MPSKWRTALEAAKWAGKKGTPRLPVIAPTVKLSQAQWRALLTRSMEREGRTTFNVTEKSAERMFSRFEPPVTKEVGTLFKDMPMGGGEVSRTSERLPIAEARAKYFSSPEEYVTPKTWAPPLKQVERVAPGAPEELAGSMAYSRVKNVPIVPPGVASAQRTIQAGAKQEEVQAALKRAGIAEEDLRPGVRPEQVLAEKGVQLGVEQPPIAQQVQTALIADQLWKESGGGRSWVAKVWEQYRASSRQAPHIKTGRDYFISSFVKWREDPSKFARAHPREGKLLNKLWAEFETSLGGVE